MIAIAERKSVSPIVEISTPSIKIFPPANSVSRSKVVMSDDFPENK